MRDSQAVLSRYAGCRTAPMGYRNVTAHTDVWLASMIWFWVVFYAPAITSVASLVPRPPFNNGRGSGNETTCWLVSFTTGADLPRGREEGGGGEKRGVQKCMCV